MTFVRDSGATREARRICLAAGTLTSDPMASGEKSAPDFVWNTLDLYHFAQHVAQLKYFSNKNDFAFVSRLSEILVRTNINQQFYKIIGAFCCYSILPGKR